MVRGQVASTGKNGKKHKNKKARKPTADKDGVTAQRAVKHPKRKKGIRVKAKKASKKKLARRRRREPVNQRTKFQRAIPERKVPVPRQGEVPRDPLAGLQNPLADFSANPQNEDADELPDDNDRGGVHAEKEEGLGDGHHGERD